MNLRGNASDHADHAVHRDEADEGVHALHAVHAAPRLLGSLITSRVDGASVTIRVTEVEAYGGLGEDPGSHAYRRRTARNATMFGPPGHAYAYFTYGMHWMLNMVTQPEGTAGAVLIRAGQVVDGLGVASSRRPACTVERDLCRGPARLAAALGIDGACDGLNLCAKGGILELELASAAPEDVLTSARTGVAGEGASTPWRFFLPGEPTVSAYRAAATRERRARPPK
ncbi:MAG: DNA-3-methyladenine glycosylase [Actinobacteria bacterium]|nr:DNA-3-methyladenine glycosylase [Actinomycetota bacterium]